MLSDHDKSNSKKENDMVEAKKPYIDYNLIPGGRRNGYPLGDAWAIVTKNLPQTPENMSGQVMLEIIGQHEGQAKLQERMKFHAQQQHLKLAC